MNRSCARPLMVIGCALLFILAAGTRVAAQADLPVYLQDRGSGIPTSMFGTYISQGEFLFYPFVEYYLDGDTEYSPEEFGYDDNNDYRGKSHALEGLIFMGYGVTDRLAVEFEMAMIDETLEKASDDPSAFPEKITESGLGDVEGQIRWRWFAESERQPELFSYFETVFPLQKNKVLIGTQDWEFKLGSGIVKGFGWGTMTLRAAVEYSADEDKFELGEYALEYLKRISPTWRVYLGVEGSDDEVELIPELQWHFSPNMFLKLNSAVGATSKATDWAPEVGVMFIF